MRRQKANPSRKNHVIVVWTSLIGIENFTPSFYNLHEVKRQHSRYTGHDGPVVDNYSSTLSLTSALDTARWSTPRGGRFTPGKETGTHMYTWPGRSQGLCGRVKKISAPTGFDLRLGTAQCVLCVSVTQLLGRP